jgi:ATP-dependent helicase STH1/SNF2
MSSLQVKLTKQIKEHGMIFTDGPTDTKKATGIRASKQNGWLQICRSHQSGSVSPRDRKGWDGGAHLSIDPTGANDATLYRVAGKFELLDRILPKLFATGHVCAPGIIA